MQSTAEPASKQIRLSREEHDVVASSLPVPGSKSAALLNTAEHHSIHASDGGAQTASVPAQRDGATAEASQTVKVSREGHNPVSTSLPKAEGSKSLSTFLADYRSDSDDDHG